MEQLKLNMIPNGVNPVFHASQYDKGRQIRFVLDETLSGAEVTTSYRAKDGTEYGNVQMSVSGNTITDTIPEDVLTDYGIIEGEVNIDGIGSLNFFVEVEKDAYDGGVITTQTASGAIATFETNIETALVSLKSDINPVQSGTGTPSPQNVRPISGFSALNVTRTGNNLFNPDNILKGSYDTATNNWSNISGSQVQAFNFDFKANTQYTFSGIETQSEAGKNARLVIRYTDGTSENIFADTGTTPTAFTKTSASGKSINFVYYDYGSSSTNGVSIKNFQIELGNQASDYSPYNGQTATVNFGQTVYGGVADVTNGKVNATHAIVDLGSLSWLYNSTQQVFNATIDDIYNRTAGTENDALCSNYAGENVWNASNLSNGCFMIRGDISRVYIKDTNYTDGATFKTAMSGVQLVYELATPIEISTTPENLTAIVGQNNVYSDTNGDTEVEYYIEV